MSAHLLFRSASWPVQDHPLLINKMGVIPHPLIFFLAAGHSFYNFPYLPARFNLSWWKASYVRWWVPSGAGMCLYLAYILLARLMGS